MSAFPSFLKKNYAFSHLLQERGPVQTWEAEGKDTHHLIKINTGPPERFREEYDFLRRFPHAAFPKAVFYEKKEGLEIYGREYVEGLPLSQYFGRISPSLFGKLAAGIARALAFLHFQGLAHGDLSGENILVTPESAPFLIDLEFLSPRHRKSDAIRGTPLTMAPELFWGSAPTLQTDLYAFGCLLYALLQGDYPFPSSSFSSLLKKHALETPPDPVLRRKEFPRSLGLVTLRLLAKEPAERFAEGNDVIRELNRALGLREPQETPPPQATAQERLRAAESFSLGKEAIRYWQSRKKLSDEERLVFAEILLKNGRLTELRELIPALPSPDASIYEGLLLNREGRHEEALRHFQKKKEEKNPKALLGLATSLYYTGRLEEALDCLKNAESVGSHSPSEQLAILNFRGNLLLFERRLQEAAKTFEHSLEVSKNAGAAAAEALSLMNLANTQTALQEWSKSLENYAKAAELYETLGLQIEFVKTQLNRAGLLRFVGYLEKSGEFVLEAQASLEKFTHPQLQIYSILVKADLEKKSGRFEEALRELKKALELLRQYPSAADEGDLWISQAEIGLAVGDEAVLEKSLEAAEALAKKSHDPLLQNRILFLSLWTKGSKETPPSPKIVSERAHALHLQGDLEFILDNALRALEKKESPHAPWRHTLRTLTQNWAQETCERLSPDDQPFFRRHYRSLWEAPAMKKEESLSPSFKPEEERALLDSILEWVRELTGELEIASLSEKILRKMMDFTTMERGFVILKEGERLAVIESHHINPEEFRENGEESLSWSLTRQAIERGAPLVSADAQTDARLSLARSVHALQLRAILVLPFRFRGEVLGAVYLDSRLKAEHLANSNISYLSGLADILGLAIRNASLFEKTEQDLQQTQKALRKSQEELSVKYQYENIVGQAKITREFLTRVDKVTDVRAPVLILGESGVGKELVARAIHYNGPLKKGPFVTANCSAIPEALAESEFFGHERGAFTGAFQSRAGLFEQAHQGTLFLDEIGDLPSALQAKLLRVLQEGEVRRVGGSENRKVSVRILAATHRNLKEEIRKKQFREDLYYRLSVAEIRIPPLRERREDIPALIDHFLEKFSDQNKTPKRKLDPATAAVLMKYDWPGNIRELENLVYNLCIFSSGRKIGLEDLRQKPEILKEVPQAPLKSSPQSYSLELSAAIDRKDLNLSEAKRQFEKEEIERVLQLCQGRVGDAARHLGIPRPQLSRLLSYHQIRKSNGNKKLPVSRNKKESRS
ncbi:MAG: sigma 54-interacting transcriptional regulator [bacterium]